MSAVASSHYVRIATHALLILLISLMVPAINTVWQLGGHATLEQAKLHDQAIAEGRLMHHHTQEIDQHGISDYSISNLYMPEQQVKSILSSIIFTGDNLSAHIIYSDLPIDKGKYPLSASSQLVPTQNHVIPDHDPPRNTPGA